MDHPNNSGMRPPFASTPNNNRMQRPRFAYSGPPNYPRPGSSASKPNPDLSVSDIMRSRYVPMERVDQSLSDSLVNNYGDSFLDTSIPNYNDSFQSEYSSGASFQLQDSIYYSCNESFSNSPRKPFPQRGMQMQSHPNDGLMEPMGRPHPNAGLMEPMGRPHPNAEFMLPTTRPNATFMESARPSMPPNQPNRFKARSSMANQQGPRKPFYKKDANTKPKDQSGAKHVWKCGLCDIVFTSKIPYDMHKNGSKHAKKLKAQEQRQAVETQAAKTAEIEAVVGGTFRCELCGIIANSPSQFQMHLDGLKHKAKVLAKQTEETLEKNPKKLKTDETLEKNPKKAKTEEEKPETINAEQKSDDKEESQPNGTKDKEKVIFIPTGVMGKTAFACATCELFLNSDVQLQQHLLGKYHKAKLEGTTLPFIQKKKQGLRKAGKGAASNTSEGKTDERVEKCESNIAEASLGADKDVRSTEAVEPETTNAVEPETKIVEPESSKAVVPETSKAVEPETSNVVEPKTSKTVEKETTKVVETETSENVVPPKAPKSILKKKDP